MRKSFILAAACLFAAVLTGCEPQYVQQPQYQQVQQTQPVLAQTCIGANNVVVADQYCDPNYIAQQQAIARQNNDNALLTSLLLYHALYSSNPYNVGQTFIYTPGSYYTSRPYGYSIQPRNTYVTNVHNHTIVVNNGKAVQTTTVSRPSTPGVSSPRQAYSSSAGSGPRQPTVRSTPSPSFTPSRSYASSATSSSSGSSGGGRRGR
jgi:hypothetical protein